MNEENPVHGENPVHEANSARVDAQVAQLEQRVRQLEDELAIALSAAADAEREQGRLQGELTKAMNEWGAACMAQEEWNELYAQVHADLERAQARADDIEGSRSWRAVQAVLTPYRWIRSR